MRFDKRCKLAKSAAAAHDIPTIGPAFNERLNAPGVKLRSGGWASIRSLARLHRNIELSRYYLETTEFWTKGSTGRVRARGSLLIEARQRKFLRQLSQGTIV